MTYLSIFVHIVTIKTAYDIGGFWPSVISFMTPGLSTIYWFFKLDGFDNTNLFFYKNSNFLFLCIYNLHNSSFFLQTKRLRPNIIILKQFHL